VNNTLFSILLLRSFIFLVRVARNSPRSKALAPLPPRSHQFCYILTPWNAPFLMPNWTPCQCHSMNMSAQSWFIRPFLLHSLLRYPQTGRPLSRTCTTHRGQCPNSSTRSPTKQASCHGIMRRLLLSRVLVTETGFGLVIGFISRLQLQTVTHNYL
jgi:hypothetical protein